MNNDLEKTELRSEKIRKIIEEAPPWYIQYGTVIIFLSLTLTTLFVYTLNHF